MDDKDSMDALTPTDAAALRLRAAGRDDAEIATELDVDVGSIGALLYLATAKPERLERGSESQEIE